MYLTKLELINKKELELQKTIIPGILAINKKRRIITKIKHVEDLEKAVELNYINYYIKIDEIIRLKNKAKGWVIRETKLGEKYRLIELLIKVLMENMTNNDYKLEINRIKEFKITFKSEFSFEIIMKQIKNRRKLIVKNNID